MHGLSREMDRLNGILCSRNFAQNADIQRVLDAFRVEFGVEIAFVLRVNLDRFGYSYINVSSSCPERLAVREKKMSLKEYDQFFESYAGSAICEKDIFKDVKGDSSSILHFGICRGNQIDGCVGLIDLKHRGRSWTDQECNAVRRLGMMMQTSLIAGRYDEAYRREVARYEQELSKAKNGSLKSLEPITDSPSHNEKSESMKILMDDFSSLYTLNLQTLEFSVVKIGTDVKEEIRKKLKNFSDMRSLMDWYVKTYVHADDRGLLEHVFEREFLREKLSQSKRYKIVFRRNYGDGNKYSQLTVAKLEMDRENPVSIVAGFSVVDEQYRMIERTRQLMSFSNYFMDTFASAYYVNIDDRSYTTHKKGMYFEEMSSLGGDFWEMMNEYIEKNVHLEDREKLRKAIGPEYLKKKLKKDVSFSILLRDISNENEKMYRLQAIRGADESHVAIGFIDVTSEFETDAQTQAVIKGLSVDYACVIYVDPNTDSDMIYRFSRTYKSQLPQWNDFKNFSERLDYICDTVVHPDDRDNFYALTRKNIILAELKKSSAYYVNYRQMTNGKMEYWQAKFVLTGGKQSRIVVGFRSVDESTKNQLEAKEKLEKNMEMIGGLATGYAMLFRANIETDAYEVYSFSDNTSSEIKSIIKNNSTYLGMVDDLIKRYVYPEDRKKIMNFVNPKWLRKELARKKTCNLIFRGLVEGGYRWLDAVAVKFADVDKPLSTLAIGFMYKDDEVREKLEQQANLEHALVMAQTASRAKTTFLNNMSHDIRTPMNAIIGYTKLAKVHFKEKNQVWDFLGKIEQSSDNLLSLINDVLDMSRIESGKVIVEEKPENIVEIIRFIQNAVQSDVREKKLKFFVDSVNVSNENVICDRLHLNRILLNVVSNSISYTHVGGTIAIRVRESGISRPGYASYEFSVRDNGIGMSDEFLEYVFEPFTREKSSTMSGIRGTGLGLAITKNIVELMGGTIDVKSKKNEGTEVVLKFEFKLQNVKDNIVDVKVNSKSVNFSGKKVLLVEDNPMNREIAVDVLTDSGMIVSVANDGAEAVEKVAKSKPDDFDVILMDIQMPVMNGYEAAKKIRSLTDKSLASIPIIAMTANTFEEDRKASYEAGMNAHLAKPVNVEILCKTLADFMER